MSSKTYELSTGLALIDKPDDLDKLAMRIKDTAQNTMRHATSATESALIVGKMLMEAKAQVKHGEWDGWVTAHCDMAIRTAQAYMRLAKTVPQFDASNTQRVALLPLRQAMRAIATDPTAPPKQTPTNISAAKGTDAEKAVAVFEKAEAALKASKKLISQGLSVNGGQVDDLRKKLNEVLAELDSLEAQISTEGAVLHE